VPKLICLLCSALLIVEVICVITVFFLFLLCVSAILVNKDYQSLVGHVPNRDSQSVLLLAREAATGKCMIRSLAPESSPNVDH